MLWVWQKTSKTRFFNWLARVGWDGKYEIRGNHIYYRCSESGILLAKAKVDVKFTGKLDMVAINSEA